MGGKTGICYFIQTFQTNRTILGFTNCTFLKCVNVSVKSFGLDAEKRICYKAFFLGKNMVKQVSVEH